MKRKIFFTIFILLFSIVNVKALNYRGCDSSTISRLKSLITNVNLSYDYKMINGSPSFDVTINNVPTGVYFVDTNDIYFGSIKKRYNFSDTQNGEITIYDYSTEGGTYSFYSSLPGCDEILLGKKYYKFPTYNKYYGNRLCEGISTYSLCQKWVNVNYSYDEFEQKINEYKNNKEKNENIENVIYQKTIIDYIVEFYTKYYYYLLIGVIVIFGGIIIVKNKREKIKL